MLTLSYNPSTKLFGTEFAPGSDFVRGCDVSFLDDTGVCRQSGCEAVAFDCGDTFLLLGRPRLFQNIDLRQIRLDNPTLLRNLLDRFANGAGDAERLEYLYDQINNTFNQSNDPEAVKEFFSGELGRAVMALQMPKVSGGEQDFPAAVREAHVGEESMTDRMLFVLNRCVDGYLSEEITRQIRDLFNPTNILVTAATFVGIAVVSSSGVGTAALTAVGFAMKGWEIFDIVRNMVSFVQAFLVNDSETAARLLALALAALGAAVIGLFLRRVGARIQRPRPNLTRPLPADNDFSDVSRELQLGAPRPAPAGRTTHRARIQGAADDARAAGWIDQAGNPTGIGAAVAPHRRAPEVRAATGQTGQTRQSAHIGATSLLESLPGYSRNSALTAQLDPSTHRSFDSHWLDWVRTQRRQRAQPTATLSEALAAQRNALQQTTGLTQRQKDTLSWILEREYADLSHGLPGGMTTTVPLPNVN
jgi:hypothetical protein